MHVSQYIKAEILRKISHNVFTQADNCGLVKHFLLFRLLQHPFKNASKARYLLHQVYENTSISPPVVRALLIHHSSYFLCSSLLKAFRLLRLTPIRPPTLRLLIPTHTCSQGQIYPRRCTEPKALGDLHQI